jgi:hypothetical protein
VSARALSAWDVATDAPTSVAAMVAALAARMLRDMVVSIGRCVTQQSHRLTRVGLVARYGLAPPMAWVRRSVAFGVSRRGG